MASGAPINDKPGIGSLQPIPSGISSEGGEEDVSSGPSFGSIVSGPQQTTGTSNPSPMSTAGAAQPSMQVGKVSNENFLMNLNNLLGQMQGLKVNLQTPNLKLNPRTRKLLDAKLKRTNENIQFISSKANIGDEDEDQDQGQGIAPVQSGGGGDDDSQSAIAKFIGYITDGQSQLQSIMKNTSKLSGKNPGIQMQNLFSMQVKLYRAQVEIEFSSAVLQKAMDDLKTVMSVQL